MSRSDSSASKRSIRTIVPPTEVMVPQKRSGAAWYRGAGHRYTVSESNPYIGANTAVYGSIVASTSPSGRAGLIPLGLPVVPDEYSMSCPRGCESSGSADCAATASS